MSNNIKSTIAILLLALTIHTTYPSPTMASPYNPPATRLRYHSGEMLDGDIPISILWYGGFTSLQKSIIHDFILSIVPNKTLPTPSVSQWWQTVDGFLLKAGKSRAHLRLAKETTDVACSIGRTLGNNDIRMLARRTGARKGGIGVVLTAVDVIVDGFCMRNCGFHRGQKDTTSPCYAVDCTSDVVSLGIASRCCESDATTSYAYIWVGNSEAQCPGKCAWPFHQPEYMGPRYDTPPVGAPNGDVGMDGMVINLGKLLAGAVTNPFGNGLFQGEKMAPVEVGDVCPGVFGKDAYPGYAGDLLLDGRTGGCYNAHGVDGRKYLVPVMFDHHSGSCLMLV
ncbi:Phi-1-like phosphate-induced protein [Zostera marina]|uniref:Phi-1-like phosphate-induced protein n=1 Tax=Zostera marina TaxID=29655 RepID=A0A0K9PHJ6_ZOSMR|nr:Phi-1-like phosphate-induced protein [Zostera marina]